MLEDEYARQPVTMLTPCADSTTFIIFLIYGEGLPTFANSGWGQFL